MKIKAYIKQCMLLPVTLSVVNALQAQAVNTVINKPADSAFQFPADSLMLKKLQLQAEAYEDSITAAIELRACVNTFTNQTVSAYMFVEGCNTLVVQGITVTGSGDLHVSAPGEITINGAFDVNSGGTLNVNLTVPPVSPPGNTMQTAINIGTFGAAFQYSDIQNTSAGFTNDYAGRPTNDVFYTFTITAPMNVTVKHCDSSIDTYLSLLDQSGTLIAYNDDYSGPGACSNTTHSYLKLYLQAGTYYVVSEGNSANGNIKTWVTGEIPDFIFNYSYDASGNRTGRTVTP